MFASRPAKPRSNGGRKAPVLDTVGWVVGVPAKVVMLDHRVANHNVSGEVEGSLEQYLAANGLDRVKVRVNEYDPVGEWRRLRANQSVAWPLRYTLGTLSVAGDAVFPGRVFGGDRYNPYTNTIELYSDVPALAVYQGARAKDYAQREYKGLYALAYVVPGVGLFWHDAHASSDALSYIEQNGSPEQVREGYRSVCPAYCIDGQPRFGQHRRSADRPAGGGRRPRGRTSPGQQRARTSSADAHCHRRAEHVLPGPDALRRPSDPRGVRKFFELGRFRRGGVHPARGQSPPLTRSDVRSRCTINASPSQRAADAAHRAAEHGFAFRGRGVRLGGVRDAGNARAARGAGHRAHARQGRPFVGDGVETGDFVAFQQAIDPHFDSRELVAFLGRDEGEGHALAAHAAGPAHAVNVVVGELRDVVVDDVGDPADVDPAAHHVGGHQVAHATFAEALHHAVAQLLGQVAVDRRHVGEFFRQPLTDLLRAAPGAAEDDCLVGLLRSRSRARRSNFFSGTTVK